VLLDIEPYCDHLNEEEEEEGERARSSPDPSMEELGVPWGPGEGHGLGSAGGWKESAGWHVASTPARERYLAARHSGPGGAARKGIRGGEAVTVKCGLVTGKKEEAVRVLETWTETTGVTMRHVRSPTRPTSPASTGLFKNKANGPVMITASTPPTKTIKHVKPESPWLNQARSQGWLNKQSLTDSTDITAQPPPPLYKKNPAKDPRLVHPAADWAEKFMKSNPPTAQKKQREAEVEASRKASVS